MLASLQAINLFWLFLILRIAKNYVFDSSITDVRSDDEDEDEEEEGEGVEGLKDVVGGKLVAVETPKVLLNGNPVESSAARKEGESYSDAVKDRRKKEL